ncbi:MAG: prepilin peptidase [Isosphaeraceae bacterium]
MFGPLALAPAWSACVSACFGPSALATRTGFTMVLLLATSAVTDVVHGKIYNWATGGALIGALQINLAAGLGAAAQPLGAIGLHASLMGGLACFLALLLVYGVAGGGAGDVKMAAALGALLGAHQGFTALFFAYCSASVFALGLAVHTLGPWPFLRLAFRLCGVTVFPDSTGLSVEGRRRLLARPIRLGPFFAAGVALSFIQESIL